MRSTALYITLAIGTLISTHALPAFGAPDGAKPANQEIGEKGGNLVISLRSEPKTLNPVLAFDGSSKEIIGLTTADLIHINRYTQGTEAALASSWTASADSRQYTVHLRKGVRFSDGHPFDADDVLFTFRVYLDEALHAPQRDLLMISGKPIRLQKLDSHTVRFDLDQPYAVAERIFDSIAILPRHLLETAYRDGKLAEFWPLTVKAPQIAGLGPFRVKDYIPGQRIILERNPYYWKVDSKGNRLPYLDQMTVVFSGNGDTEAMRFRSNEIDIVSRLTAANFATLDGHQKKRDFRLYDLGASLEYSFLFFNLNDLSKRNFGLIQNRQKWFRQVAFRRAVSNSIDREGIVRLAYQGRAYALSSHVTPGNRHWENKKLPRPAYSPSGSREGLRKAGFSWGKDGRLLDSNGEPVQFSILYNAGNQQQAQMATIIQADLQKTGIDVKVVGLEFRALYDRVFQSYEYDSAILSLTSGDADPNTEMSVWTSGGSTHVWNFGADQQKAQWQEEVDQLMKQQMVTLKYEKRKAMYDRVQQLIHENLPVISLVSPNLLVGARTRVGNFYPAILGSHTTWNAEHLFVRR